MGHYRCTICKLFIKRTVAGDMAWFAALSTASALKRMRLWAAIATAVACLPLCFCRGTLSLTTGGFVVKKVSVSDMRSLPAIFIISVYSNYFTIFTLRLILMRRDWSGDDG